MAGTGRDHDRDTGVPDRVTTAVASRHGRTGGQPRMQRSARSEAMQAAIGRLRLQGAVFLRADYREPWAYESLSGPETAALLRLGTERVILFHVVATGSCWVAVGDGPRHWARPGTSSCCRTVTSTGWAAPATPRPCRSRHSSMRRHGPPCPCSGTVPTAALPMSSVGTCTARTRCSTRPFERFRTCSWCVPGRYRGRLGPGEHRLRVAADGAVTVRADLRLHPAA
jgi:hypothetical protein